MAKEPLEDVDRAVLVTIHHQAAVRTAIRAEPQRHVFHTLADMTRLGGTAFADDIQFFPKAQTLVVKHLHKAVETPIIIHHAVADLPLAPLFVGLALLLLDDHLPLGKIANDHGPFSQSARDEMGGFMQTVPLFAPLLQLPACRHARDEYSGATSSCTCRVWNGFCRVVCCTSGSP